MEPLIRHGHEMKSSEIDTPRPREGRAREKDSEAASFIKIRTDYAKAAIPQFAYLKIQGSAKRQGLGCVNSLPGSARLEPSKQPRLFADLCNSGVLRYWQSWCHMFIHRD